MDQLDRALSELRSVVVEEGKRVAAERRARERVPRRPGDAQHPVRIPDSGRIIIQGGVDEPVVPTRWERARLPILAVLMVILAVLLL